MEKKIKKIVGVIVGVLFLPIIIFWIVEQYWRWNGFLLSLLFDVAKWEIGGFTMARLALVPIGALAVLVLTMSEN